MSRMAKSAWLNAAAAVGNYDLVILAQYGHVSMRMSNCPPILRCRDSPRERGSLLLYPARCCSWNSMRQSCPLRSGKWHSPPASVGALNSEPEQNACKLTTRCKCCSALVPGMRRLQAALHNMDNAQLDGSDQMWVCT